MLDALVIHWVIIYIDVKIATMSLYRHLIPCVQIDCSSSSICNYSRTYQLTQS